MLGRHESCQCLFFQIVRFLPSNSTAPRVDCAFLVSAAARAVSFM